MSRRKGANVVVKRYFPLRFEQGDAEGCELLCHGADVEDRLGGDGYVVFQVCQAIALLVNDCAILHHRQGAAWRPWGVVALKQAVDPVVGGLDIHWFLLL